MYISKVRIEGFRSFKDTLIELKSGINTFIGENNSGKTTVLKALALVFDRRGSTRPTASDFTRPAVSTSRPPEIRVSVTIRSSGPADTLEDLATVAEWLVRLENPWEAQLTFLFSLPEDQAGGFLLAVGEGASAERYWRVVEDFLPRFVGRVFGGKEESAIKADGDLLGRFQYQFLDALRDADAEMVRGSAPLLKAMLQRALDDKKDAATRATLKEEFQHSAGALLAKLIERVDLTELLKLATATGAEDGGIPGLAGTLEEADLLSALGLVLRSGEATIPASLSGSGYKNLLYMSLVMAQLEQSVSRERLGQNASVFPILVIEEPEAHLHPSQQYKLLKYVADRVRTPGKCRQVLLSTHSTHVTSAVDLDSIIWFASPHSGLKRRVAYPGRCFPSTADGQKSKRYVERYLDATKSTMLFSRSVLLVEGIAEQLLLPLCAESLGRSLAKDHVAVVSVAGVTFRHFLPLFGSLPETRQYAMHRRVACVLDADPARLEKTSTNARYKSCWPYQLDVDKDTYSYKAVSDTVATIQNTAQELENLRLLVGEKTLEYDIARWNTGSSLLAFATCEGEAALQTQVKDGTPRPDDGGTCVLSSEVHACLVSLADEKDGESGLRERVRYATCHLCKAESLKGEHAFSLCQALRGNLELEEAKRTKFTVPPYLRDAIAWVCA